MNRAHHHRGAFTLFEVLVAIALIAMLLGAVLGFLARLQSDRAAIVVHIQRSEQASKLLERLESEMLAVIAGDATLGPGLKGDGASLSVLSRAMSAAEMGSGGGATPVAGQNGGSATALIRGGLGATRYSFNASAGVLTVRRSDPLRNADQPDREAVTGLKKIQFRFYADGPGGIVRWTDKFDSIEAGGLPRAIEVALWFSRGPQASETPDAAATDAATTTEAAPSPPDRVRVIAIPAGGL